MCKKVNNKKCSNTRIDKCMVNVVKNINWYCKGHLKVVACCCGHKKYPMTIVVRRPDGTHFDFVSDREIPRTRNFYRRDKSGFYYIPEVEK